MNKSSQCVGLSKKKKIEAKSSHDLQLFLQLHSSRCFSCIEHWGKLQKHWTMLDVYKSASTHFSRRFLFDLAKTSRRMTNAYVYLSMQKWVQPDGINWTIWDKVSFKRYWVRAFFTKSLKLKLKPKVLFPSTSHENGKMRRPEFNTKYFNVTMNSLLAYR